MANMDSSFMSMTKNQSMLNFNFGNSAKTQARRINKKIKKILKQLTIKIKKQFINSTINTEVF